MNSFPLPVGTILLAMERMGDVIYWTAVLLLAAISIGVLGYLLRKRLLGDPKADQSAIQPFTLADLRQLHRDGALTDEEFDRAKNRIIAQARAAMNRSADDADDSDDDDPLGPEPGDDDRPDEPDDDDDDDDGEGDGNPPRPLAPVDSRQPVDAAG